MLSPTDLPLALYELQLTADAAVQQNLQALTPLSALTLFGAGLLTSLTPCCLSMLPLTFAFLASGASEDEVSTGTGAGTGTGGGSRSIAPALAFTAGLATALAALGVLAASVGKVYGDTGGAGGGELLRAAVSLGCVGLGLNLLNLLPVQLGLGSLLVDPSRLGASIPPAARAFAFGASSALVASPCASPVLATILGFVATLGDPLVGGALLLAYTAGYTAPVLVTSLLATSARDVSAQLEGRFEWVSPSSGAFLVAYGTYNALCVGLGPV